MGRKEEKKSDLLCVYYIWSFSDCGRRALYESLCLHFHIPFPPHRSSFWKSIIIMIWNVIFFFFKTWVRFQMWKSSDRLGSFETCFTALEREICDCVRHIFNTHKKRRWLEIYLSSFFNFSFYFFFFIYSFLFSRPFSLCVYIDKYVKYSGNLALDIWTPSSMTSITFS